MALNQIERAILVTARTYLSDKSDDRICHAICRAAHFIIKTTPQCRSDAVNASSLRLRVFIMDAIDALNLECWLRKTHPDREFSKEDCRSTRIAWIDWLLDEPWTEHKGGPCPLLPGEKVIIRKRNGAESGPRSADSVRWEHAADAPEIYGAWATAYDCVAYKVIYEAPTC